MALCQLSYFRRLDHPAGLEPSIEGVADPYITVLTQVDLDWWDRLGSNEFLRFFRPLGAPATPQSQIVKRKETRRPMTTRSPKRDCLAGATYASAARLFCSVSSRVRVLRSAALFHCTLEDGARDRVRTGDHLLGRQRLCQLSYSCERDGSPRRIRTAVSALRGPRPGPARRWDQLR